MADLSVQKITSAGVVASLAAAGATGDTFANNGIEYIEVKNAHASTARTVTINAQRACDYGGDHDITVSVAASTTKKIGPFSVKWFNNADGKVEVTYSSNADLTIGAFRLG